MTSYIYEPPYLPVISVVYKVVGVIGTVVNMGGIFVSLLSDTKKMNAFSRFILNVQVCNTVSLIYITVLSCPFFVPSLGLTYNGVLTYNFNVSPYTQTTFFVLTYCFVMCSYISTYMYLHQAVMSPFDRFKFSTKTLAIAIVSLHAFILGVFPALYSFGKTDHSKLATFLAGRNGSEDHLVNASNFGFYNVHLNSFIYWLMAIPCATWIAIFLAAVAIIIHIMYKFKKMSLIVLQETRYIQLSWFKSFLLMTSIPVLCMVPNALIINVLLWDKRPFISLVVNLLNVITNIHSPLVTIIILVRIQKYKDTIKSWFGFRRSTVQIKAPSITTRNSSQRTTWKR